MSPVSRSIIHKKENCVFINLVCVSAQKAFLLVSTGMVVVGEDQDAPLSGSTSYYRLERHRIRWC